ncbi:septum formation initiator family protein [Pseudomonadota bacterium]
MKFSGKIKKNKNLIFFCIISLCIILYFTYHTFSGKYGLISYLYQAQYLEDKKIILNKVETEFENKQNKVSKLKTNSIDMDLLDEKSREILGTSKTNEIIIYDEDIKQLKDK